MARLVRAFENHLNLRVRNWRASFGASYTTEGDERQWGSGGPILFYKNCSARNGCRGRDFSFVVGLSSLRLGRWPAPDEPLHLQNFIDFIPSITYIKNMKKAQLEFLRKGTEKYGGSLLTKRKYRQMSRPISTKHSMHF